MIYFVCLLGWYAGVILLAPGPPMLQDYPTWVYEGVAVSRALQGHPFAGFSWKHFPVPNLLSDFGLGLLCSVMPWKWAARLWLCFYLVLSFFACLSFSASLSKRSPHVYWIAPTIIVLNLCFWWGFLNFQLSVVCMLLFCYYLFKSNARPVPLGALLVVVFLSHAISLAVCAIALLVYVFAHKTYRLLLVVLPVGVLASWYVYGRFLSIGNPEGMILSDVPVPYLSRAFAVYKINTFFKCLGYVNPKLGTLPVAVSLFGPGAVYVLVFAVAALGVVLIYLMSDSARAAWKEGAPDRLLWLTVGLVLVAAFLCPSQALGISDPGSRFMVCALAIGVMLLRKTCYLAKLACGLSASLGVIGAVMFAAIAFQPHGLQTITDVREGKLAADVAAFAHVEPQLRAYYYDALQLRDMSKPVFGTSLLYNRHVLVGQALAVRALPR